MIMRLKLLAAMLTAAVCVLGYAYSAGRKAAQEARDMKTKQIKEQQRRA